jgi:serine/threonine protein kinase
MLRILKTIASEKLNQISGSLQSHPNITMRQYQYWLDRNPIFHHDGRIERIRLLEKLNQGGTNDVFKAHLWFQSQQSKDLLTPKSTIVVKICKPYAPKGPDQHHNLNMILGAFSDEIRINNLVRATNVEGVVRSLGGGGAGRITFLKMEFVRGRPLDHTYSKQLTHEEKIKRIAQLAYLANTISMLHHYDVVHKDLKPKNLILCDDENHRLHNKILILDFGYATSKIRDTVTEYGGQLTPLYSAPEQAIMGTDLEYVVDYYSFGVLAHEFLTGYPIFPDSLRIFMEDGYTISERYLDYVRRNKELQLPEFPEIQDLLDKLTIFDSTSRKMHCPNLFNIAHQLRSFANKHGVYDSNTEFLTNQLRDYGHSF